MTRFIVITTLEWLNMQPHLVKKYLLAEAESLATCKLSICCMPKMSFRHGRN